VDRHGPRSSVPEDGEGIDARSSHGRAHCAESRRRRAEEH
jgi:hypothetical protein